MPAEAGKSSNLGGLILPEIAAPDKRGTTVPLDGGAMPVCAAPLRRVFDPRGGAMFADEIRRAVEAAPRVKLPEVAAVLWRAFADSTLR